MDEMMRVTATFLKGEVPASSQARKKALPAWKQQEVGRKQNFDKKGGFRNQQRSERRRDKFTLLTESLKEILALDKGKFKAPPPMTTLVEKRNNNKFYEFHREVGHNTNECMHLKRQIEELIKNGKLSHSWQRVARQKITQSFSPGLEISFPLLGDEDGIEGPMIIESEIGGHFIHRIYVDGGSASEILYEHCFNRLRPEVKNQMVPAIAPLIGFSGEIIWPMGQILLPVKIRDAEHFTSTLMNFVVVGSPSPYNGIIGRPGVRKIQAASEERIKVAIHPEYLEQTIVIGSTLTEEGRKALYDLLRRSLDVFSWKPADMTGVPRHISEHRINVREGCPLVRQKKISQAPERNKAIKEEVEKLVDSGIMKEVYYHSWISNPVMVKKHDDSWRMCVDFKDLNKACPKDDKVGAVLNLPSPKCLKDVQKLNGKLVSLNRFLSKSAEKSLPFFKTLKKCTKKSDFQWTMKSEAAFKEMKKLIA
ncbi:hypothetical protein Tco_0091400 [Tanacetum coccineum]